MKKRQPRSLCLCLEVRQCTKEGNVVHEDLMAQAFPGGPRQMLVLSTSGRAQDSTNGCRLVYHTQDVENCKYAVAHQDYQSTLTALAIQDKGACNFYLTNTTRIRDMQQHL